MCAPSTTWRFMIPNSSFVSLSGLFRTSSGVCTFPMSCISAAKPNSRKSGPSMFSARQPALQRHLLDAASPQIAREADERGGAARQPRAVDHHLVADEADDHRRRALQPLRGSAREGVDAALHERVAGRIQLRAPQCRRQPPNQLLGLFLIHSVLGSWGLAETLSDG